MNYKWSLGADPEMLVGRQGDIEPGNVVPIVGLLGGTKDEPLEFRSNKAVKWAYPPSLGYKYQEDGVVAEVNIPAVHDSYSFSVAIKNVRHYISSVLANAKLYVIVDRCSHRFSNEQLASKQAQTLGCDPDFVAYNEKGAPEQIARPAFKAADLGNWRHAGGHVHFGFDKDLIPDHVFVNLVDALMYLPLLPKDVQPHRRPFYGKAGLFRPKDYGIEYRSMSNFWLQPGQYDGWNTGYELAGCVGYLAESIQCDVHRHTELIAAIYQSLPWPQIKAIIDTGVSTDDQKREWIRTMKVVLASIDRVDKQHMLACRRNFANGMAMLDGRFFAQHPMYKAA